MFFIMAFCWCLHTTISSFRCLLMTVLSVNFSTLGVLFISTYRTGQGLLHCCAMFSFVKTVVVIPHFPIFLFVETIIAVVMMIGRCRKCDC